MENTNKYSSHNFGRIILHAACLLRQPQHFAWHWNGIFRELQSAQRCMFHPVLSPKSVGGRFAALAISLGILLLSIGSASRASAQSLQVGSTNVQSGEAFDVPITVDSGTNALGFFDFGLNYDPSVLRLTAAAGDGPLGVFVNTNYQGHLVMFGLNGFSLTAPTGLVMVARISFVAIGSAGSSTTLEFTPGPTEPLGVGDTDGVYIPVTVVNGTVNIAPPGIEGLVPCAGPASGGDWRNHGEYVAAVASAARQLLADGMITQQQLLASVQKAAQSGCGVHSK